MVGDSLGCVDPDGCLRHAKDRRHSPLTPSLVSSVHRLPAGGGWRNASPRQAGSDRAAYSVLIFLPMVGSGEAVNCKIRRKILVPTPGIEPGTY